MKRTLVIALITGLAIIPSGSASSGSTAARCDTVWFDGVAYVFYRDGISCRYAKYLAGQVHKRKSRRPARGWRCSSGSDFTTGAYCEHAGGRIFGWHPFD